MKPLDKAAKLIKHKLKTESSPLWKAVNQGIKHENNCISHYIKFIDAYNDWSQSSNKTYPELHDYKGKYLKNAASNILENC